jgi:hypothetical protein
MVEEIEAEPAAIAACVSPPEYHYEDETRYTAGLRTVACSVPSSPIRKSRAAK